MEAATLACATLELMRCARVHNHPEPFVRRAALLAAGQVRGRGKGGARVRCRVWRAREPPWHQHQQGVRGGQQLLLFADAHRSPSLSWPAQVLGSVPPARLATAMLNSVAGGGCGGGAAAARDAADDALVSRLEWLRGWVAH